MDMADDQYYALIDTIFCVHFFIEKYGHLYDDIFP